MRVNIALRVALPLFPRAVASARDRQPRCSTPPASKSLNRSLRGLLAILAYYVVTQSGTALREFVSTRPDRIKAAGRSRACSTGTRSRPGDRGMTRARALYVCRRTT